MNKHVAFLISSSIIPDNLYGLPHDCVLRSFMRRRKPWRSMAGAEGFEPPIIGPKPIALPLGHAPNENTKFLTTTLPQQMKNDSHQDP